MELATIIIKCPGATFEVEQLVKNEHSVKSAGSAIFSEFSIFFCKNIIFGFILSSKFNGQYCIYVAFSKRIRLIFEKQDV